jgi:ribosomal protein L7Ae-like RNA K-turn-binding protein
MKQSNILSFLGLAYRGRNLVWGEQPVLSAIREKTARIVLVASDASENTVSRIRFRATENDIPVFELTSNKVELGAALGKATCASVAITDAGIALSLLERLDIDSKYIETTEKLQKMKKRKALKAKQKQR